MKKLTVTALVILLVLNLSGCASLGVFFGIETEPKETEDIGYLPEFLYKIADSLNLSLGTSDGTDFGPYKVFEIPENLRLGTYTVVEEADVSRYDRWLTISAGNNRAKLTVYDGYRDLLCYQSGETVLCYQDADGKTFEKLRQDFDEVEYQAESAAGFVSAGDPAGPLREYAGEAYPRFRMGLSQGSRYRYEDYDLMSFEVTEQTGTTAAGTFSYYAKADPLELPEGAQPGTGAYEGWYYITESVCLELGSDGVWYRVEEFDANVSAPDTTEPTV